MRSTDQGPFLSGAGGGPIGYAPRLSGVSIIGLSHSSREAEERLRGPPQSSHRAALEGFLLAFFEIEPQSTRNRLVAAWLTSSSGM